MALELGFEVVSSEALPNMVKGGYENWTDHIQAKAQQLAGGLSMSQEVLKEKRIVARDQLYRGLVEEFKAQHPTFTQYRLGNDLQPERPVVKVIASMAGVVVVLRKPVLQ
ncbi:hypothetical protein LTR84_002337 [Exophiala bonariae]|uniref:Uncharacterized protein n=1 Tax=Exophiala bonariae TaxID=1690606 RepID=A0AAV9MRE0_9EURO|nr:hypothetical protein LTR84_002337 [Exophiala bonariae]